MKVNGEGRGAFSRSHSHAVRIAKSKPEEDGSLEELVAEEAELCGKLHCR